MSEPKIPFRQYDEDTTTSLDWGRDIGFRAGLEVAAMYALFLAEASDMVDDTPEYHLGLLHREILEAADE